jgi:hypothetical protein
MDLGGTGDFVSKLPKRLNLFRFSSQMEAFSDRQRHTFFKG